MVASEIEKPVHSCGRTAKATGLDQSFIFARGTHFRSSETINLSQPYRMVKLYPSLSRMGYDSIDKTPIALRKVAVNNVYDMSISLSHFSCLFCAPDSTARNRITTYNISHALIKSFHAPFTVNSVVTCDGGDFSFNGISYLAYLNEIAVELAECLGQVLLGEI